MLKAEWTHYDLNFTFEAITSRERMWHKRTYFVRVWDTDEPQIIGVGECPLFRGLSADDVPDYEQILEQLCRTPSDWNKYTLPSIHFGFETAIKDLKAGGNRLWTNNQWAQGKIGIPINGLIWMGDYDTMTKRIEDKLNQGFRVLKLKIGGIDFEQECDILKHVRECFNPKQLEIRLDANGSFSLRTAMHRLEQLSIFDIHSIEQPISAGQQEYMSQLCRTTPIPIALDEELIGWRDSKQIQNLLEQIHPQYLILKPALIGGVEKSDEYIRLAENLSIGWWATSTLESNIGLNAIAQWLSEHNCTLPQGLGTGQLYSNNIESPLYLQGDSLFMNPNVAWENIDNLSWQC